MNIMCRRYNFMFNFITSYGFFFYYTARLRRSSSRSCNQDEVISSASTIWKRAKMDERYSLIHELVKIAGIY